MDMYSPKVVERAVLQPGRGPLYAWLLPGIACSLVGAIGWIGVANSAGEAAWWMALGGTLFGAPLLALAARSRLILTPEGFRLRYLFRGRLVPWTSVLKFYPSNIGYPPLIPGVTWLPRDIVLPRSMWGYLRLGMSGSRREMNVYGGSRDQMLQTLNAWLAQYGGVEGVSRDGAPQRFELPHGFGALLRQPEGWAQMTDHEKSNWELEQIERLIRERDSKAE
jgi:hypothetical protein